MTKAETKFVASINKITTGNATLDKVIRLMLTQIREDVAAVTTALDCNGYDITFGSEEKGVYVTVKDEFYSDETKKSARYVLTFANGLQVRGAAASRTIQMCKSLLKADQKQQAAAFDEDKVAAIAELLED